MSGVGPEENLDVASGAAMAVLPHVGLLSLVGLYALAVGVALIVLALRLGAAKGARTAG